MLKARAISRIGKTVRSSEWWDYKITSIFGTGFAASFLYRIPPSELFPFFFFLLAALIPGASYVSLLNDLTDLKEDGLAGKTNRLEGKSKAYALTLIFGCLSAGLIVGFFLSKRWLTAYCLAWIIFTLYSLPPVRLKNRGVFGVAADALGTHVFPHLFAIFLLTDWYGKEIDPLWLGAAAVWSLALGLRGILWHQLKDKDNDRAAGVKTFAVKHTESFVVNTVRYILFPVEISTFLFMLFYARNKLAFVFLGVYITLDLLRRVLWSVDITLAGSSSRFKIFMEEYYGVFYAPARICDMHSNI